MKRVVHIGKDGKSYICYHGVLQEVMLFADLGTWLSKRFAENIKGKSE